MNRKLIVLLLSLSSLAMTASQAVVVLVEDQSTFLSLISGPILENFETATQGTSVVTNVGTFANSRGIYIQGFGPGDGSRFPDFDGGAPTTLTLLPGYSAAGSQVFADSTSPGVIASIVVTDSNSATYTFTNLSFPAATGSPSTRFIGFVSDPGVSIVSIQYSPAASRGICVDNYVIATAVPEPSTVAALAFGGVALSLLRLRKRNR